VTQIGLRARQIRIARGEAQEAVARRADIATTTLNRIENGRNQPSLDTVVRLAAALEVSVTELMDTTTAA
jgi:transcriptional regulator with XRE-family HTH domain